MAFGEGGEDMKETICSFFALMGAILSWAFGGWDAALAALVFIFKLNVCLDCNFYIPSGCLYFKL